MSGSPQGNALLAAAIEAAGCTYAGLARRVNDLGAARGERLRYDKTSVSHWLAGTQPRPTVRYLVAEALAHKLDRPMTLAELGLAEPESPGCAGRALRFDRHIAPTVDTLTELGSMDLDRRSVLKMVPFVGAALLAPQRDWLLHLVETDVIGPAVLAADGPAASARAMVDVFDELDNRFGGGHARVTALHYLAGELLPRLRRPHPAGERRELFTVAAKLAAMTGWMTYDVGGYGLAQRYMTQALRLCAEGGDHVLAGQILAGLSHLATNVGNPQEGLALARAATATAKRSGSPLGLMRIHAMRARAHAALGEPAQTAAAISDAERALDASRGPAAESDWVRYLDAPYLALEMACCFRDLGEHDNAEHYATAAVPDLSTYGRRQTLSLAVQASARLQRAGGDVDAAVATARRALDQLDRVSSERSAQALRRFRRQLAPHRRRPTVRAFEAEARARLGAA